MIDGFKHLLSDLTADYYKFILVCQEWKNHIILYIKKMEKKPINTIEKRCSCNFRLNL